MKYLITVAYNGSDYHGYQFQDNAKTVAGTLYSAALSVFCCPLKLTGCSRTDSGVHARDFKATIDTENAVPGIPACRIPVAMNTLLPSDISVLRAEIVDESFHPRYDVKSKEYEYLIYNAPHRDPFLSGLAYHVPRKLNVELMNIAAEKFIGKHDFSAFMNSGSDVCDTVREIYYCTVTKDDSNVIHIRICGNGFLYNMVRIIVGTLISVSDGNITPDDIENIIASGNRSDAGLTAPACGLYLNKVTYKNNK